MDRVQAGILMLGTAVALVELYRRGYLGSLVGSLTNPKRRPFTLPTEQRDTFLGGAELVA